MTDEQLFEIASRIYIAHVRAGQQTGGKVLVEQTADLLPTLYEMVKRAWTERDVVQDLLATSIGNVN